MQYSVSTWNYLKPLGNKAHFQENLAEIRAGGFGAELWLNWTADPDLFSRSNWPHIRSLCEGLPSLSAHSAWTREFSLSGLLEEMDLCAHIGADPLVCHPRTFGLNVHTWDYNSAKTLTDEEIELIGRLLSEAASRSLRLALENGPADTLDQVLKATRSHPARQHLGICIDMGHANMHSDMSESPIVDILHGRDHIIHLHLHDNYGKLDDHRVLGDGTSDWPGVFGEIGRLGYDGDMVFELNTPEPARAALAAKAFVQEQLSRAANA